MGKYHVVGGGQDGGVNALWDGETQTLCLDGNSHLSLLWIGSIQLSSFVNAWRTGLTCVVGRYALHLGLQHYYLLFLDGGLEYL